MASPGLFWHKMGKALFLKRSVLKGRNENVLQLFKLGIPYFFLENARKGPKVTKKKTKKYFQSRVFRFLVMTANAETIRRKHAQLIKNNFQLSFRTFFLLFCFFLVYKIVFYLLQRKLSRKIKEKYWNSVGNYFWSVVHIFGEWFLCLP